MKVYVKSISQTEEEQLIIKCHQINEKIQDIINFVKSTGTVLPAYRDGQMTRINLSDIFYLESVDDRVFAYTEKEAFELKCKLYEFEELYARKHFFRCAKSCIINLLKVDSTKPILNGRYQALLFNGEKIIISRQYAATLKKLLLGKEG